MPLYKACLVTPEDRVRRETIIRVMCDLSLDYAAMGAKPGINFTEYFAKDLATLGNLEADGIIRRTPGGVEVTNLGRLFIRNTAMRFDNQLAPAGERRHSRTI